MNLQDQVLYRCIHADCARTLPRRVNFCPYCGTGQRDGVVKPVAVEVVLTKPPVAPPVVPEPAPATPPAPAAPVASTVPQPIPTPAAPRVAVAAVPPQPRPIRLRYWLMALAVLAAIWFYARPSAKRIDARIEQAIALSAECKAAEAQAELTALRDTKATPAQLQRLQSAINSGAAACDKKRTRVKAWSDASEVIEGLLKDGEPVKAQARLNQFVRIHGSDAETRALKTKIAAQREAQAPPPKPAAPAATSAQQAQSARNLISEAERDIAMGNYKAASDKLEACIAMVDSSRECASYKVHADGMLRQKERCLAINRTWSDDRCQ